MRGRVWGNSPRGGGGDLRQGKKTKKAKCKGGEERRKKKQLATKYLELGIGENRGEPGVSRARLIGAAALSGFEDVGGRSRTGRLREKN